MRLPRVRLRLWWLMVLIGAIAVFLGTWIEVPRLRELSRIYRSRANHYAELERRAFSEQQKQHECLAFWSALAAEREQPGGARASSGDPDGGAVHVESRADRIARTWEQAAWHAREAALWESQASQYARMRRKWQRVAAFPWLPVEPDPPNPER